MSDVTRILAMIDDDPAAADRLLALVYDELRRLAAARMKREAPGQTLEATALVHEAWMRLLADGQPQSWANRRHFFAAAAEAMRRILVEVARRKARLKHGGRFDRVELDATRLTAGDLPVDQLLAIDEAIDALARADAQAAELVKLIYFSGLSVDEAAELLGIARRTAYRHWSYARAWIFRHLELDRQPAAGGPRDAGDPIDAA